MLKIARQLLRIAQAVVPSVELSFTCKGNADVKDLDAACAEVQDLLNRIRVNEELQFLVTRQNDGKKATLQVGISTCDAKDAILAELKRKAKIQCRKRNLVYHEKALD